MFWNRQRRIERIGPETNHGEGERGGGGKEPSTDFHDPPLKSDKERRRCFEHRDGEEGGDQDLNGTLEREGRSIPFNTSRLC